MSDQANLVVTTAKLKNLADDLDRMQEYLDKQIRRMDEIVDGIEVGWRGPAAQAYRAFHRGAAEDAVRIRQVMQLLEKAVRLSRDGFTEQEMDTLDQFRQIQSRVDIAAEARDLSTSAPGAATPAQAPSSRLGDL
ncbi:WXG100 family type VII secretion target [Streptomyces scopuliridis]